MRFVLIAYDYTDSEAPARRKVVRPRHMETMAVFKAAGTLKYSGPLLSKDGTTMIGSLMIHEYPSEEAMREGFLSKEPYAVEGIWEKINIYPHFPAEGLFADIL